MSCNQVILQIRTISLAFLVAIVVFFSMDLTVVFGMQKNDSLQRQAPPISSTQIFFKNPEKPPFIADAKRSATAISRLHEVVVGVTATAICMLTVFLWWVVASSQLLAKSLVRAYRQLAPRLKQGTQNILMKF